MITTEDYPAWRVSLRKNPSVCAVVRKTYAFDAYLAVRLSLGANSFTEVDCVLVGEMSVVPVQKRRLE